MKKALSMVAILILGLFVLSGCSQQPAAPAYAPVKTAENAPVKEFVIESFVNMVDGKPQPRFSPDNLTVNKGDLVRIKITNIKGTHDFKIDEFGVYAETPLDQEVTVEFVADKAGSFEYYCTKPGHRQNGHWGTLKVLE